MKGKPHLYDDTVTLDPHKDRLVQFLLRSVMRRTQPSQAKNAIRLQTMHSQQS